MAEARESELTLQWNVDDLFCGARNTKGDQSSTHSVSRAKRADTNGSAKETKRVRIFWFSKRRSCQGLCNQMLGPVLSASAVHVIAFSWHVIQTEYRLDMFHFEAYRSESRDSPLLLAVLCVCVCVWLDVVAIELTVIRVRLRSGTR